MIGQNGLKIRSYGPTAGQGFEESVQGFKRLCKPRASVTTRTHDWLGHYLTMIVPVALTG